MIDSPSTTAMHRVCHELADAGLSLMALNVLQDTIYSAIDELQQEYSGSDTVADEVSLRLSVIMEMVCDKMDSLETALDHARAYLVDAGEQLQPQPLPVAPTSTPRAKPTTKATTAKVAETEAA